MYADIEELKKVKHITLSNNNKGKPIKYVTASVFENKRLTGDAVKIYGCLLALGAKQQPVTLEIISDFTYIMMREVVESLQYLRSCKLVSWKDEYLYVGNKTFPPKLV